MSLTPPGVQSCEVQSPDIFASDIRRNLDGQFLNARDSIEAENMCVYARVRPMLPQEAAKGYKECIAAVDEQTVRTVIPVSSSRYKNSRQSEEVEDFSFSSAFGPETGQFVFFVETMLPTLQNFVEGGNSLIFSYGITGSGKTYTLQGNSENPGIIPLSLRLYFAAVEKQLLEGIKVKPNMYNNIIALSASEQREEYRIKKQLLSLYDDECEIVPGSFRSSNNKTFAMTLCDLFSDDFKAEERQTTLGPEEMASAQAATVMKEVIRNSAQSQHGICNVWVSFVEIYNENIFDLLTPVTMERKRLMLRECNGNVYIEGAREICVSNGDEALKILNIGRKNLSIASTKMNYQSSRSHCIYTIRVVRVRDANNLSFGKVNRLSFCDLAGSERTAKTHTTGIRLKEAGCINTSLLVLGRCLEQLRMNQMGRDKRMIPFRDSKLTRLFSGFFMGQGKALMIANASPCDYTYDETSHVLKFSALARKLKVNDTFYSDATSTLQSICNEWSNASNRSMCNESTDSLDSDSEIIQKKDEIIEKLLILAEKLTKKEEENADMEMKIRQEVCREYSEYSDQLLEEKRIMYEEQIEAMRENYKKLIANREKMYEKIIEEYKHRLGESMDSNEDTFNNSHSIMELENSAELSPEKSLNEKNVDKSEESYQSQSSKLKELESTLESVTAELAKAKEELCDSQKSVANLDKELKICKEEKENLSSECADYKNVALKSTEDLRKYEADIKDLEEELCILKKELDATKELNQSKEFNLHEMESDNDMLKAEVKTLKKDIHRLKDIIETYEANMEEYKTKICALEDELLSSEKKYVSAKEDLQIHMNSTSEMEKENEVLKLQVGSLEDNLSTSKKDYASLQEQLLLKINSGSEIEKENGELKSELRTLTMQINEFKEEIKKYISSAKDYETKICNLEGKLVSNEKHFEDLLQEKLTLTSQLEKELKSKIIDLEAEVEELQNVNTNCKATEEKYKTRIIILEEKLQSSQLALDTAEKQIEGKSAHILELEKEIEMYKNEIRILETKSSEAAERLKEVLEKNESDGHFEQMTASLQEKLKVAEEELKKIFLHSIELLSELEVDDCQENASTKVQNSYEQLSDIQKSYQSVTKKFKEKISSLHQDLLVTNKNADLIKKEMKVRETVSAELEKEIDMYKHDIEALKGKMLEKDELEKKLTSLNQELETVKDVNKQISSKLNDIEMSRNSEEPKKEASDLISEKLEEELSLVQNKLSTAVNDIQEKNSKIAELEIEKSACDSEIQKLKQNQQMVEFEVTEQLKTAKAEVQQLSSKLCELQNEKSAYESEIQQLKQNQLVVSELTEKLHSSDRELKTAKDEIQKLSSKICELETQKSARNSEIQKLKQNQQMVESEVTEQLKTAKAEVQQLSSKLCELQNEKSAYESEIQQLKQNQMVVSQQTEKLHSGDRELKTAKDEIQKLSSKICELETQKSARDSEIQKLKQNQQMVESEVTEQLKTAEAEVQQLSSKLCELQNEKSAYESEIQQLKQNQMVVSEQTEKLHSGDRELKTAKDEIQTLSSKICELETQKSARDSEIQKLKQNQQMVESEVTEKLKTAKDEVQQLSLKLCELQNEKSAYESEIQQLKQNQMIVSELTEKLHLGERELKTAKDEIEKLSSKICELETQKSARDSEIQKLKQNQQMVESEVTEKLKTAKDEVQQLSSKLCELQNEKSSYASEIQQLKENQVVVSDLTEKLHSCERELKTAKDEVQKLSKKIFYLEEVNSSYELDNKELKKVQEILRKNLREKLTAANNENRRLSSELLNRKYSEFETVELELPEELETAKAEVQKLSSKISELEKENGAYESEIQKLKENQKAELTEKLHLDDKDLKTAIEEIQKLSSKICELEKENTAYKSEIDKLKQQEQQFALNEKLLFVTKGVETANEDNHQKSAKLHELQNSINTLKSEIEKLQEEKQNLISEKMALQKKLVVTEREIEILKQDVQQKSTNEQKTESEICDYEEKINKLKEDCANLHSEKLKFEREINCYKEKVEKLQKNSPHGQNGDINTVNQNKLKELEREITVYKQEIKKVKDDQDLSEKEKEDLMMVISTNNEKMDDLEDKLTALNEDLNAANDDIFTKTKIVEDLENRLAQFCTLIELLEKCETRASDKIKELQDAIEKHKSQDLYLHNQLKNKGNSIEELEKAVFDLQEQLKNVQRSCDHKLVSELEQHETEIVQTLKLKHLVEEENMNLKKQKLKSLNSKLKSIDIKKAGNTTEALSKKNVDNKGKENVPEASSSRALRKKEINLKEASFSSIECSTPIVDRVKSRKRVSDEDFEPSNVRAAKKMKSTEASKIPQKRPEASKIPQKRPSRRRLQNDKTETLSPIQKIANSIASKAKALSSNISHISSPRLTRGRKKLFNLEAPSSSGSQRATKERK